MEEHRIKRIKSFHTFNATENELKIEKTLSTIETKIELLDNKINQIGMLCNYMVKAITNNSEKSEQTRIEILNSISKLQLSFNNIINNNSNNNNNDNDNNAMSEDMLNAYG